MTTLLLSALFATAITINLPGGPPVGMDYLTYDPATDRIWVPAGNTGNVDVIDATTGKVTTIGGLATAPARRPDRPRMGPSSATVGDGVIWIGNRGDNQLHAFDGKTLAPKGTVQLPSMPDGLAYIKSTRELWATTPRDQTITVAPAGGGAVPAALGTVRLTGAPEGFAVDDARGIFYTNLEDKNRTLAIDIKSRKVIHDWPAGCGAEGPRGLALDGAHRWLFVACTDGAGVLDVEHDGKVLGHIATGAGVDNLDYDARRRLVFIASGKDGNLVIAHVDDHGALAKTTTVPTAKGARNPVLDARGRAYVEDAQGGRLLIVEPTAAAGPAH